MQVRQGFNVIGFIKTPYGLMIAFMVFSMYIMPKLKVDPEEYKDLVGGAGGCRAGGGCRGGVGAGLVVGVGCGVAGGGLRGVHTDVGMVLIASGWWPHPSWRVGKLVGGGASDEAGRQAADAAASMAAAASTPMWCGMLTHIRVRHGMCCYAAEKDKVWHAANSHIFVLPFAAVLQRRTSRRRPSQGGGAAAAAAAAAAERTTEPTREQLLVVTAAAFCCRTDSL